MNDPDIVMSKGRIELTRVFPVTPEVLWAYLVEDEHRRKWLCGGEVEARVGGTVVFDFDHRRFSSTPPPKKHAEQNAVRFEGEVLIWEPPKRFAFSWPEADGRSTTQVVIDLVAVDAGTKLQLVHQNLDVNEDQVGAAAGWHTHFDLLAEVVTGGRSFDFWLRHTELEALYRDQLRGA